MSAKKKAPTTPKNPETENKVFFMATVEAVWKVPVEGTDEFSVKTRKVNILLEHHSIHLSKTELDEVNRGVFQRLQQESGVAPSQVADIILLNISILGNMTSEQFYGKPVDPKKPTN